jgi:hypothetical protein
MGGERKKPCQYTMLTANFTNSTPITIGASISIKGDFASDGAAVLKGYQLWAQTINNSGGLLGRPVRLVILNDDSTPEKVTSNYQTLINKDHVNLIFGPFSTLLTKAAAKVAEKAKPAPYAFVEGEGGGPSVFDLNSTFKVHTDVFNTVQGPAVFPSTLNGVNSQSLAYLFQWQSGSFIPVYPSSAAAQNPEFPKAPNY